MVQDVQEFYCPISDEQEVHLKLRTDAGTLQLHVGPGRFLRSQQIKFENGDQIEALGSALRYMGADALLVREITRDNEVYIVRDHAGTPLWR